MRRLVLLIGVAALATGIWILVASMGTAPVPVGITEDTPAEVAEPGSAIMAPTEEGEEITEPADAGFERSAIEAAEATALAGSERFRVLVTKKETGEPLPGAEVTYFGTAKSAAISELAEEEREELQRIVNDQEQLGRRYGEVVFADSEGLVFIPVEEFVSVTGRYGDLYGQLQFSSALTEDDGQYELELEHDLTLVVRVLDSLGDPAVGVPISILPRWEDGAGDNRYFGYGMATSEAPEGVARIRHLQAVVRNWSMQAPPPIGYLARPYIPGLTEGGVAFDLGDPPTDPLVLRLPPTGRIVVRTTDANGRGLPGQAGMVSLAIAPEEPPADLRRYSPPSGQQWYEQEGKGGTTVFDWAVAGKTYLTTAYLSMESLYKIFPGPVVEDHEVEVTLSLENEVYNVVGRVVDEHHEPVTTRLQVAYETEGGGRGSRSAQPDEDGSFMVTVAQAGREVTLTRLTIHNQVLGMGTTGPALMYAMEGARALSLGNNDLGELVLGSSPVVASGRILVDGEPPRQVPQMFRFRLQIQRAVITEQRSGPTERWNYERNLSVTFLDEGRFEIHGAAQPARYRLQVNGTEYLPVDPVEFSPGWEDLLLDLETGASLRAVLLLDRTFPMQNLWVRLAHTDGRVPEAEPNPFMMIQRPYEDRLYGQPRGQEQGRHTFMWSALSPGTYRFEVLPRGARAPLVTVEDVVITNGKNDDPRLDGIDLRGKLRQVTVTVQDMNGRRLANTNSGPPVVLLNDPTAEEELQGFRAENGRAVILTAEPYLDLMVVSQGFKPKEVYGVREDTAVRLEPFSEIAVRIAGGLPALPEGNTLRISVSRKGRQRDRRRIVSDYMIGSIDSWLRPQNAQKEVDDRGRITLQVEGDGTYTVSVSVRHDASRRSSRIREIEPTEIEVQTSVGPQVFEISIPEEELEQAIERAAGR